MNNSRNKEFLLDFGRNLKKRREFKGLSQEELCFAANLSKNQIGNIERGEVNTTISTVFALSRALNSDISDLFIFRNDK